MNNQVNIANFHSSNPKMPLYNPINTKSSPQKICDFFPHDLPASKIVDVISKIILANVFFCFGFIMFIEISRLLVIGGEG